MVRGEGRDLTELREIQDWLIAPQLKTVRGVTEITAFGGHVKQYTVEVLPGKLREYGLSLGQLADALQANNSVSGGNYLEHNDEQYIIRGFGQVQSREDLESIIVDRRENRPIQVRDVAKVKVSRQLRQGAVTQDGKGEVVTGIVMMLRGGNGREVIDAVTERVKEINAGLPAGVRIERFYDQSDLVERTTHTIIKNLAEGGFFVVAVLLLFAGRDTRRPGGGQRDPVEHALRLHRDAGVRVGGQPHEPGRHRLRYGGGRFGGDGGEHRAPPAGPQGRRREDAAAHHRRGRARGGPGPSSSVC